MTTHESTANIRPIKSWSDWRELRTIINRCPISPGHPRRVGLLPHFWLWVKWRRTRVPILAYIGKQGEASGFGLVRFSYAGVGVIQVGVDREAPSFETELWQAMTALSPLAVTNIWNNDHPRASLLEMLGWRSGQIYDGPLDRHARQYLFGENG